jgi:hypothetical protein
VTDEELREKWLRGASWEELKNNAGRAKRSDSEQATKSNEMPTAGAGPAVP